MVAETLMAGAPTLESLGRLLGALAARPGPLPKHRYPSAGTLYPVQAYLSVAAPGLPGVPAGSWYYDPVAHDLARLSDAPVPAPDAAPLHLLLVAETAAIAPAYPDHVDDFCLLEAGYMIAALEAEAAEAGLVLAEAASPEAWDGAAVDAALQLGPTHRLLGAWTVRAA